MDLIIVDEFYKQKCPNLFKTATKIYRSCSLTSLMFTPTLKLYAANEQTINFNSSSEYSCSNQTCCRSIKFKQCRLHQKDHHQQVQLLVFDPLNNEQVFDNCHETFACLAWSHTFIFKFIIHENYMYILFGNIHDFTSKQKPKFVHVIKCDELFFSSRQVGCLMTRLHRDHIMFSSTFNPTKKTMCIYPKKYHELEDDEEHNEFERMIFHHLPEYMKIVFPHINFYWFSSKEIVCNSSYNPSVLTMTIPTFHSHFNRKTKICQLLNCSTYKIIFHEDWIRWGFFKCSRSVQVVYNTNYVISDEINLPVCVYGLPTKRILFPNSTILFCITQHNLSRWIYKRCAYQTTLVLTIA